MSNFPAEISSLADLLIAKNNWTTRLLQAAGAADTDLVIEHAAGIQLTNGLVSIDDEIIVYAAVQTGGDYPILAGCTRGYDGTTPRRHEAGAIVEDRWVAEHNNRLIQAINDLANAVGTDPAYDPNSGVRSATLAARLNSNLPTLVPMGPATVWELTHNRRRLVRVELFRTRGRVVEPLTAPIRQSIDVAGLSTVTATLDQDETGYMLLV